MYNMVITWSCILAVVSWWYISDLIWSNMKETLLFTKRSFVKLFCQENIIGVFARECLCHSAQCKLATVWGEFAFTAHVRFVIWYSVLTSCFDKRNFCGGYWKSRSKVKAAGHPGVFLFSSCCVLKTTWSSRKPMFRKFQHHGQRRPLGIEGVFRRPSLHLSHWWISSACHRRCRSMVSASRQQQPRQVGQVIETRAGEVGGGRGWTLGVLSCKHGGLSRSSWRWRRCHSVEAEPAVLSLPVPATGLFVLFFLVFSN